jgi:hypothetical protein
MVPDHQPAIIPLKWPFSSSIYPAIKWWFSIVMLVYQRVNTFYLYITQIISPTIFNIYKHVPSCPLVAGFNPSEKYESQLGSWHSQYMENKIHVPNHQPVLCLFFSFCLRACDSHTHIDRHTSLELRPPMLSWSFRPRDMEGGCHADAQISGKSWDKQWETVKIT